MEYCLYYDERNESILDVLPKTIDPNLISDIDKVWSQRIPRLILKALSKEKEFTLSKLKEEVGHSLSTLHEALLKLESLGLVESEIIYSKNKQRIIRPKILCVTRNPKNLILLKKFFQGIWINSKKSKKLLSFFESNSKEYFSVEEISVKIGLKVDEVEILLSNWDSFFSRGVSEVIRDVPFEKKVLYKGKEKFK